MDPGRAKLLELPYCWTLGDGLAEASENSSVIETPN